MSNMHLTPRQRNRKPLDGPEQDNNLSEGELLPEILTVLHDSDARAILQATSDEPKSAMELSECCGLPSSTAYRKIDQLTELGLLEENLSVKMTGHHVCKYELQLDSVHISLRDGVFDCQITHCE